MFDYFFAALVGIIILAVLIGGPARSHLTPTPRNRRAKKPASRRRMGPVLRGVPHRPV